MVHFTQEGGDISSEMFSPPSPLGWSSEGVPKTLNNIVLSFSATSSFARGAFSQVFDNYCARRSLLISFITMDGFVGMLVGLAYRRGSLL